MFAWKYRIHAISLLSAVVIIYFAYTSNIPDKNRVEATKAAAIEFLTMVDAGNFADSWQIAAPYLQENVPLKDWEEKLAKMRATLGAISGRELENVSFAAPAKNLPESELILLEYDSTFEQKDVSEIVTVVLGDDNRWRVVGYFIQ